MNSDFKKLCRIAGDTVVRYRLIADGDRILVGASGGKDSFVLLRLLDHLRRKAPVRFDFAAATFDPGFPEFGAAEIADYCRSRNWEHHTVHADIPAIIADKNMEDHPCMLCSRLRRGLLYKLAGELNCGKLALGQHLDDVISSFFMSLCRGQGITTMAPRVVPEDPAHPVVIRPLALVPEDLIAAVAAAMDFPRTGGKCRYEATVKNGDRARFRRLTDQLAAEIPGLRGNIAASLARVETDHLLRWETEGNKTENL
ncbi:MAG: hypothetical protein MR051_09090 [Lentisphaeria bacterium]|nr:hypothetical protein [Lentisphaeria bacterium]